MSGPVGDWTHEHGRKRPDSRRGFCDKCWQYMPGRCPWCGWQPPPRRQLVLFDKRKGIV